VIFTVFKTYFVLKLTSQFVSSNTCSEHVSWFFQQCSKRMSSLIAVHSRIFNVSTQ